MATFDEETLERWRRLGPRAAYDEVREALFRLGAASSADFHDAFESLVEEGVLTWSDIEGFERS
jgi:hypothetical protein